jgi:DDE superfamily endonuclease
MVPSDESRFNLFHNDGRVKILRRPGERYHIDCLAPTVKHGGGSVMVWGCISWWGVGPLVVVEGTLNKTSYVALMEKHLEPYLKQLEEEHPGIMFQEDNAPCHTSGPATQWRQEHGINRMPWPSQSPDLNPIEHLWDHLNRQVRKRNPLPSSLPALAAALKEEWAAIPLEVVRKHISSMPDRVAAVIKAKGRHTSY